MRRPTEPQKRGGRSNRTQRRLVVRDPKFTRSVRRLRTHDPSCTLSCLHAASYAPFSGGLYCPPRWEGDFCRRPLAREISGSKTGICRPDQKRAGGEEICSTIRHGINCAMLVNGITNLWPPNQN